MSLRFLLHPPRAYARLFYMADLLSSNAACQGKAPATSLNQYSPPYSLLKRARLLASQEFDRAKLSHFQTGERSEQYSPCSKPTKTKRKGLVRKANPT